MKNLKQVLALGMAFSLSLSTLASAAFTDQESISKKNTEAVELLTALDVIQGYEDGSFKPENTVTRAQMAKMIYTIRNGGNDNADAYKSVSTSFDDIQGHWAEGYIKYLQNTKIVAGKSATKFKPDDIVTTAEAMKMALVLGGYTPDKAGLEGAEWLNNTVSWATTNKLDKNVVSPMAGACTRQDAAQILSNALNMNAVQWSEWTHSFVNDGSQGLATGDPITVGEKWMDLSMETGKLTKVPSGKKNAKGIVFEYYDSNNKKQTVTFKNATGDYAHLLGCEVTVVWNNDNVDSADAIYGIYGSSDNVTYEGIWKDVTNENNKVKFDGSTYDLNKTDGKVDFTVYVDGEAKTGWTANRFDGKNYSDEVVLIDNDGDGDLDAAQVNTKSVVEITYVGSSSMSTSKLADNRGTIGGDDYVSNPKLDDVNVYDGIAKGDFAVVSYDKYTDKVTYEKAELNTATIEATRTKNGKTEEIKIDGNWLKAAAGYKDFENISAAAGDTVEYVAVNGLVYNIKKTDGKYGSKSIAMIYNLDLKQGEFSNKDVMAQVILRDGTKKTVKVNKIEEYDSDSSTWKEVSFNDTNYTKILKKFVGVPMSYTGTDEMSFRVLDGKANKAGFGEIKRASNKYDNNKDKKKYNGFEIADDAVVFVFDTDKGKDTNTSAQDDDLKNNDVKVITGSELKNANITGNIGYATQESGTAEDKYAVSTVDGFDCVQMMSIGVDKLDNVETRGKSYAYLTANAYGGSIEGKSYTAFDVWTPDGAATLYQYTDSNYEFEAGTIITYEVDSTKDGKTIIKSVDEAKGLITGAFTSNRTDGFVGIDGKKYDLANDAIILNVDTAEDKGIEGNQLDGVKITGCDNVMYYTVDGEIVFMLVDSVNEKICGQEQEVASTPSIEDVKNALEASNEVTVNGDLAVGGSFELAKGKTLTVKGKLTVGNRNSVEAYDEINEINFVIDGKLDVAGELKVNDDAILTIGREARVDTTEIAVRVGGIKGEGGVKKIFINGSDEPYDGPKDDSEAKKVTK